MNSKRERERELWFVKQIKFTIRNISSSEKASLVVKLIIPTEIDAGDLKSVTSVSTNMIHKSSKLTACTISDWMKMKWLWSCTSCNKQKLVQMTRSCFYTLSKLVQIRPEDERSRESQKSTTQDWCKDKSKQH